MVLKVVYENGVFRPVDKVELPEHTQLEFEARILPRGFNDSPEGMDEIYKILSMRFDDPDSPGNVAERHNEHQP